MFRFFFNGDGLVVFVELDDAIFFRMGHVISEDRATGLAGGDFFEGIFKVGAVEEVIAEDEASGGVVEEVGTDMECLGEAFGFGLLGVSNGQAPL